MGRLRWTESETRGIANEERDHGVGIGLFFADPDGRQLEAITYAGDAYPRMPSSSAS